MAQPRNQPIYQLIRNLVAEEAAILVIGETIINLAALTVVVIILVDKLEMTKAAATTLS